jgi:hypothetical protein
MNDLVENKKIFEFSGLKMYNAFIIRIYSKVINYSARKEASG